MLSLTIMIAKCTESCFLYILLIHDQVQISLQQWQRPSLFRPRQALPRDS
jgi:hypothetical protein